jgi:hypothetical protein
MSEQTDFPVSEVCDAVPQTHMFRRSDPDSGTFGQKNLCTGDFFGIAEIGSLPKRHYNQFSLSQVKDKKTARFSIPNCKKKPPRLSARAFLKF